LPDTQFSDSLEVGLEIPCDLHAVLQIADGGGQQDGIPESSAVGHGCDVTNNPTHDLVSSVADVHRRHVSSICRLQLLAEVARLGLGYATVVREVEVVQGLRRDKPIFDQLETYAQQQSPHFYDLHALVTVRLWSVLEAFVHDICCLLLAKVPSARQQEAVTKLKAPVVLILDSGEQEQAEYLCELLDSSCSAALKPGVGRFEAVLGALGYGGPVHDVVRRELFHCSKLRNCIVHNDAIVDSQLVKACPWWAGTESTRAGITSQMSQKHLYAVCWYMMEIQRRVLPSDFPQMDKLREEQQSCIQIIEQGGCPGKLPFA
jgi:hypothetical protein